MITVFCCIVIFYFMKEERNVQLSFLDTLFYTLKTVIDFEYYWKIEIPANQFEEFLELAMSLQIKDLNNSLRKDRTPDIGSSAEGNAHQCPSSVNQSICKVESSWPSPDSSNSSSQLDFHLSEGYTDSKETNSTVPFNKCSGFCGTVQSQAVMIPPQDQESRNELNDPEVYLNTEISVKHEQLYSETETKDNVLDGVERDEPMSGNFESEMNDEPAPTFEQALVQYSCDREPLQTVWNPGLVIILLHQPHHYYHLQQQVHHQQHQQLVTPLSGKLSSPPKAKQHDLFVSVRSMTKSEKPGDDESKESVDVRDVPGNDADGMSDTPEPHSSAEYILPGDYQATQRRSERERRPHQSNSLPTPSEQQETTSGTAFSSSCSLPSRVRRRKGDLNQCDVCGKPFGQSRNLAKHRRTHTGERPYVCGLCEKAFTQLDGLICHMRSHTGERPYVCEVCGKTFARSKTLAEHKHLHTGERPHSCNVCEKTFKASSNLATHKRTHTGVRPYACDVCEKTFTQSQSLTVHKRIHSGERPYVCHVCEKSFTTSYSLVIHKRTHTGERPFKCHICGKDFSRPTHLTCHKRIHTPGQP